MQRTSSTEMEGGGGGGMNSILSRTHSQVSMEDLHHHHHHHHQNGHSFHESQNSQQHDDFLEQMLSTIPNCGWPPQEHEHEHEHEHDLSSSNPNSHHLNPHPALKSGDSPEDDPSDADHPAAFHYPFEDSSLASKLRQMSGKSLLLQQQLLLSRGGGGGGPGLRSPSAAAGDHPGMLGLPLSLGSGDSADPNSPFKSPAGGGGGGGQQGVGDASVQALYNGFAAGSLHGNAQPPQFHPSQGGSQNFGGPAAVMNQGPPASASTGGSSGGAPQRQRVRARRGQATDPHSIAERLRRERIAERMKALQELVPNANKTDKASMLDEIIDYVKFLQLQVKVLSMSRLGGAGAVAPLVADMSSEGVGGARTPNSNGNGTASTNESMTMTEQQVAKLMEEDMGSAMQYLQGKGLCLMPISLATAISTATCHSRNPLPPTSRPHINHHDGGGGGLGGGAGEVAGPTSPNMSVLTVQSANAATTADPSVKDTTTTTSATKP